MNVHVKKTVPIEYYDVAKAYQKVRKGGKTGVRKAMAKLKVIKRENPELFYHWQLS